MKNLKICINTIDRDPNYVFDTALSLWETLPSAQANLFVGNPNTDYLETLRKDERVHIWRMNQDLWNQIQYFRPWRKRVGTLLSTLQHWSSDESVNLLLCEDDIIFKSGWFEELQLVTKLQPEAFITLYSTMEFSEIDRTKQLKEYSKPIHVFGFGLLGIFVPSVEVKRLTKYVKKRIGPWCISADDLLTEYINEHESAKLFATAPSWIDHRGDVSSIPENQSHGPRRAPSF